MGILKIMPDAKYELLHFSLDEKRHSVSASAIFRGTHTGEAGPMGIAPTLKSTSSHYTYVMVFEGMKIKHMVKIWNNNYAFQ